ENKPINGVSWYDAMAFCIWDGGYLPTEAEWNYAATGGGEQRAYPWSNPAASTIIDCSYANYYPGAYCTNNPTGGVNRVGFESPKGDGRWTHSDLAGNVWEWVLDWYVNPYPNPQACNDCANLNPSAGRVIRGGGFNNDVPYLRPASRIIYDPSTRYLIIGF